MTKKQKPFIALIVLSSLSACGLPPEEEVGGWSESSQTDRQWWKSLSQAERNQSILERAFRDLGARTGQQCKEWARTVIAGASRNTAVIPPNCSWSNGDVLDASGWYWCGSGSGRRVVTSIRNVQPGWIVQMRRRNRNGNVGPHTAIVSSRGHDGIWWIDANWGGDTVVRTHYQSFSDFEWSTTYDGRSWYSVYVID